MSLSPDQSFIVLGVLMRFLVKPGTTSANVAMIHSELRPGTTIPLHSHADSEIFYLLSGSLEAYEDGVGWSRFEAGQAIAVTGGVKHALRNMSSESTFAVAVTGKALYNFFVELAAPFDPGVAPSPPSPQQLQHLFAIAGKYGYWLGSPEDNAVIGIKLG